MVFFVKLIGKMLKNGKFYDIYYAKEKESLNKNYYYGGKMKVEILNKSIFIVDYEQQEIRKVNAKGDFDTYIRELIKNITENETVRLFKVKRETTEVLNCVQSITKKVINEEDNIDEYYENIANKLLSEEIKTQEQISPMGTSVKKGSLLEVILYDSESETYSFLIAKVAHKNFIDDEKFERRTGYSTEENKLGKSCLFQFYYEDEELNIKEIRVFLDNSAKYWTDNFLEIDPMNEDDKNTNIAFRSIEQTLSRNIKKLYPRDYTTLRNSVICYFRSKEMFSFDEMYQSIFATYVPMEMQNDVYIGTVSDKIKKIKDNPKFDNQFKINQKIIKVKIQKIYEVNNSVQMKITDGIDNLDEIIHSYIDPRTNEKYLQIKTTIDETYNSFKKN